MEKSYVYIVECADGSLYTGWTTRPLYRIAVHNEGKGAKYTRGRRPVTLVYLECLEDRPAGLVREAQIKKLTAAQKRILIRKEKERSAALIRALEQQIEPSKIKISESQEKAND